MQRTDDGDKFAKQIIWTKQVETGALIWQWNWPVQRWQTILQRRYDWTRQNIPTRQLEPDLTFRENKELERKLQMEKNGTCAYSTGVKKSINFSTTPFLSHLCKCFQRICSPFVRSNWRRRPSFLNLCPNLWWSQSFRYQPARQERHPWSNEATAEIVKKLMSCFF